jgi:hypothetical protein
VFHVKRDPDFDCKGLAKYYAIADAVDLRRFTWNARRFKVLTVSRGTSAHRPCLPNVIMNLAFRLDPTPIRGFCLGLPSAQISVSFHVKRIA